LTFLNKIFHFKTRNSIAIVLLFVGCSKVNVARNPYLPDVRFQYDINLNLPEFDGLRFAGGSHLIHNVGYNGVLVFNLNGNDYLAWEATCSNHVPESCSKLSIEGVLAKCSCEDFQYSLATGQLLNPTENLETPYSLLFYQVIANNNILRISN